MPTVSRFFGIAIYVYRFDHGVPHFHARYGDQQASIAMDDSRVLGGDLSPRALRLVQEWSLAHRPELMHVWQQAQTAEDRLDQIEPLR
ncbi:MAG TPA: DUF4160 domain-containing protein [Chloroflexota bacterium]|nr:DUF4160 domain-containing protein [Chloroflexota bacterium]